MHSLDDANLMCIAVATNKLVITNKLVKTITQLVFMFFCYRNLGIRQCQHQDGVKAIFFDFL